MSVVGLTERKLRDARFRKTEEAIFKAFFGDEDREKINVSELIQQIGINKATFYRHHRAACEIVEDYEQYILGKYDDLIKNIRVREGVGLRRIYYEMLIFVLQNREIFQMLIARKRLRVINEMVSMLKMDIINNIKLLENRERFFRVYVGEIVGLIEDWGIMGFKEMEIIKLLDNMMYLTETAQWRLLPLVD